MASTYTVQRTESVAGPWATICDSCATDMVRKHFVCLSEAVFCFKNRSFAKTGSAQTQVKAGEEKHALLLQDTPWHDITRAATLPKATVWYRVRGNGAPPHNAR